ADAGRVHAFQRGPVTAGRHPTCDLRVAAHAALEVSARHAVSEHDRTTRTIRYIVSTTGTFVNGEPVCVTAVLGSGHRIACGAGGPLVEVEIPAPGHAPATLEATRETPAARESTTVRIRAEVARETRRLRIANIALALVLAALAAAFLFSSRRQQASFTRERAALLQRI